MLQMLILCKSATGYTDFQIKNEITDKPKKISFDCQERIEGRHPQLINHAGSSPV